MSTRTPTEAGSRTRVAVGVDGDRVRVRSDGTGAAGHPLLRPVLLSSDARRARVSLVPEGALLLAGDRIRLELDVSDDAVLEVVEPGGTVAYDMRGGSAAWEVSVSLGPRATLVWHGEPFVLSAGAEVVRTTSVRLSPGARLLLRETLVLGRHGETAGRLRQRTDVVAADGGPLLVEELDLDPASAPRLLGGRRALGSVLAVGVPEPPGPESLVLTDGSFLERRLGEQAHAVQAEERWRSLVRATRA